MEVRVLGPVQVVDGDRLISLRPNERVVIARLVAARGRAVSDDVLIDVLWGDAPPASARKTLHGYVHRIRRAVGADSVVRGTGGYRLAPTVTVDIDRLDEAVVEARRAVADGLLGEAVELFRQARSLFRGEVLSELRDDPAAAGLRRRVAELELTVNEELAVAELRRGSGRTVIGELEVLIAMDPTRERSWCLLVSALAGEGRQADALNAVARARRALALELGVEPGPQLRELEQAVLDQQQSVIAAVVDSMFGAAMVTRSMPPADAMPDPLPTWGTPFYGRADEIAWLMDRVCTTRLVVLTGPGGVGKTRLAVAVAGQVLDTFEDGALRVGLAGIADDAVDYAIAAGVHVRREPFRSALDSVAAFVAERHMLLLVDNCDDVVGRVKRAIATLVSQCPRLHVLATSRQPLRIPGVLHVQVRPLDREAALELLVDRVAASSPDFDPDAEQVRLDQLCQRLDGIPLALELAAAQCRTMTPGELLVRLERHRAVLADRRGLFEERHRDLDGLIDWSWQRLSPLARRVVGRLTAVIGSFTLDTAEGLAGGDGVDDLNVVRALEEVEDVGLVVREHADGGIRHRLLEPIRQHVAAGLDSAERDRSAQRHAEWFRDLTTSISAGCIGQDFRRWADRAEGDLANFRESHRWFVAAGDAESAVRTVEGLSGVAVERGLLEVADWCDATVKLVAGRRDSLEAAALASAAPLWWLQNRPGEVADAAARMASVETEPEHLLRLESVAALAALDPRDWASAIRRFESALARYDPDEDTWAGAQAVMWLVQLGARPEAEAIKVAKRLNSAVLTARLAFFRAIPHFLRGDPRTAAVLAGEAVALARDAGMTVHLAVTLAAQGEWRARIPDVSTSDVYTPLLESLDLWERLRVPWGRVMAAEEIALALAIRGQPEASFVLWGAADTTGIDAPGKWSRPSVDPYLKDVAADRRASWRRRGEAMTLDQALSYGRQVLVAAHAGQRPV
jgi:predicted ATPase/DNA-binding SARP family transcriptional activator